MPQSLVTARPVRVLVPEPAGDRRGVRFPPGADSKLFGGWGVRF
jgi:hypothetical protein